MTALRHPAAPTWRRITRLRIKLRTGPERGREITVEGRDLRYLRGGRSELCEIVLGDERVDSAHFELTLLPAGVFLRDLESEGGCFVSGVRVKEAWLAPGSIFTVGESELELVAADAAEVPISARTRFGKLFGATPVMRELFESLGRAAPSADPALITGASGTGKDLVARALHEGSPRRRSRFITVPCDGLSRARLEAQLFGHLRGALPGAREDRPGCFERAGGGTVFLNAVDSVPADLQPRLCEVLDEQAVVRVGEPHPRKIRSRVFAASRADLQRMVAKGRFHEGLYRRLSRLRVVLPSLAEHVDDIVPLAEGFLDEFIADRGLVRGLSDGALQALRAHRWPGNVRELRTAVEYAYTRSDAETISADELGLDPWGCPQELVALPACAFDGTLRDAREAAERIFLRRLLASDGSQASKAHRAGLTEEGLRLALKRLGLR